MTTRRTFLAGIALPTAAAAHQLPVPAGLLRDAEKLPDAGLIALGKRWRIEDAAYEVACDREGELYRATVLPERPDALYLRDSDIDLKLQFDASHQAGERSWFFVGPPGSTMGPARSLRGPQSAIRDFSPGPEHDLHEEYAVIRRRVPWPERQARADEIVAAYDAHEAAKVAAKEASGLAFAATEAGRLGAAVSATTDEIHATPALTLVGLAVKAAVLCHDLDAGYDVEAETALFVRNVLGVAGASREGCQGQRG